MEDLISSLESLARQIYLEKKKFYTFTVITDQERENATAWWKCENNFSDNDQVVLDQCHYIAGSWIGHILSVILDEKQEITFQW